MSTHRNIDLVCVVVTVLAIVLAVLFMNGERLGIQKKVDQDSETSGGSVYFTNNDLLRARGQADPVHPLPGRPVL